MNNKNKDKNNSNNKDNNKIDYNDYNDINRYSNQIQILIQEIIFNSINKTLKYFWLSIINCLKIILN